MAKKEGEKKERSQRRKDVPWAVVHVDTLFDQNRYSELEEKQGRIAVMEKEHKEEARELYIWVIDLGNEEASWML